LKFSIFGLWVYSLLNEYRVLILIAHIKLSFIFAFLYVVLNYKKTLNILKKERYTLYLYLLIVISIVLNDLIVDANMKNTIKSVLLHFFSFYLFIFFVSIFSKNESYFPRFLIIFSLSLLFFKNQEYLLDLSRVFDAPYFKSRLSSLILYSTIGVSYFLIEKNKERYAVLLMIISFFILQHYGSRSTSSILFVTLLCFVFLTRYRLKSIYLYSLPLVIYLIYYYLLNNNPEIIAEIIIARIDLFSSIYVLVDNFPLGIGSGGIVDNSASIEAISSIYNFSSIDVHSASNSEYSTSHSLVFGAMFKNGLFASIPLYYLLFKILHLNIKTINYSYKEKKTRGRVLLSTYIVIFMVYSMIFSGYGQFLTIFPIMYAATISIFRNGKTIYL